MKLKPVDYDPFAQQPSSASGGVPPVNLPAFQAPTQQGLANQQEISQNKSDAELLMDSAPMAALRGATQGATFGFGDEAAASLLGAGSYLGAQADKFLGTDIIPDQAQDASFDQFRRGFLNTARGQDRRARELNPGAFLGGELAGGLTSGGAGGVRTAGQAAAQGAKYGAAYGLGTSEADIMGGEAGQALEDAAVSGVFGGLTGGALKAAPGVAKLPGNVAKKAVRKLAGVDDEALKAYEAAGINPTLDQVSDSKVVNRFGNLLREFPGATKLFANADDAAKKEIEKTIAKQGKPLSNQEAGEILRGGIDRRVGRIKEISEELYNRAEKNINQDLTAMPEKSLAMKNKLLEQAGTSPTLLKNLQNSKAFKLIQDIEEDVAANQGLTFNTAKNIRSAALSDIRDIQKGVGEFGERELANLKQVASALGDDMYDIAKASSPKAARDLARANKFYKEGVESVEKNLKTFLNKKTPEEIYKAVISGNRVGGTKVSNLVKTLNPQEKEHLRGSLIRDMGAGQNAEFSLSRMVTQWKGAKERTPEALEAIYKGSKGLREEMDRLVNALEKSKSALAQNNPSGTAYTGNLSGLAIGGAVSPVTAAGLLAGGNMTARMMTSPKVVNWLANSVKNPAKSQKELSNRLTKLAAITGNEPELQEDAIRYADSVASQIDAGTQAQASQNPALPNLENANFKQVNFNPFANQTNASGERDIGRAEEAALIRSGWNPEVSRQFQQAPNQTTPMQQQQPASRITRPIKDHRGFTIKPDVYNAIAGASQEIGMPQGYMLAMAAQESGFRPGVKAKTSSATGLYQFIDSTWRNMVKKYGKEYGIGLGDRKDPRANAIMGALFTKDNANILQKELGRQPTPGELYMAHFLGAGGAKKMLKSPPNAVAAEIFPRPARSNKFVFYSGGRPRTIAEVKGFLDQKVGQQVSNYSKLGVA
jgi:soluble lytic murein transglycosylase-like protein